jgi:predicted aldo/keto reductase-like oxidoreductase
VHEVIRPTDPDRVFAPGGAIEALIDAKKAGKLRFIGFTGHKDPDIHLAMIAAADKHGFTFDTVQLPLNVMDAHYRSFEKMVLPVAEQKGMGILGMKPFGGGIILESKTVTAAECLRYALNVPSAVMITGCDSIGILDQAIDATIRFTPMTPPEVQALLERTREAAAQGAFERFKIQDEPALRQHREAPALARGRAHLKGKAVGAAAPRSLARNAARTKKPPAHGGR